MSVFQTLKCNYFAVAADSSCLCYLWSHIINGNNNLMQLKEKIECEKKDIISN